MLKINGKELIIQLSDQDFEYLVAPKPNGLRLASSQEAEDLMRAGSELLTQMPSFPFSFINKSLVAETLAQSKGLTLYGGHVTPEASKLPIDEQPAVCDDDEWDEEEEEPWEQEDEEWDDDDYDEWDDARHW